MEPMAALTTEYLEQRLGHLEDRFEQRFTHLESLLIERFERRLADTRVDILKWSFLFWIGQVAAIGGMLTFAMRSIGR
jgi:hypothetical protein